MWLGSSSGKVVGEKTHQQVAHADWIIPPRSGRRCLPCTAALPGSQMRISGLGLERALLVSTCFTPHKG